jgi:hypothetical protein
MFKRRLSFASVIRISESSSSLNSSRPRGGGELSASQRGLGAGDIQNGLAGVSQVQEELRDLFSEAEK